LLTISPDAGSSKNTDATMILLVMLRAIACVVKVGMIEAIAI
jgi:hypothetical protein